MAETVIRNENTPVAEREVQELSGMVAEQVAEILQEADQRESVRMPVLAYRIPSPGVRYYF